MERSPIWSYKCVFFLCSGLKFCFRWFKIWGPNLVAILETNFGPLIQLIDWAQLVVPMFGTQFGSKFGDQARFQFVPCTWRIFVSVFIVFSFLWRCYLWDFICLQTWPASNKTAFDFRLCDACEHFLRWTYATIARRTLLCCFDEVLPHAWLVVVLVIAVVIVVAILVAITELVVLVMVVGEIAVVVVVVIIILIAIIACS